MVNSQTNSSPRQVSLVIEVFNDLPFWPAQRFIFFIMKKKFKVCSVTADIKIREKGGSCYDHFALPGKQHSEGLQQAEQGETAAARKW
jgi:hypothetical protein